MNVILIVSDTLCDDCAGDHGLAPYRWDIRGRPRTPHIDRFAAQFLVLSSQKVGAVAGLRPSHASNAPRYCKDTPGL